MKQNWLSLFLVGGALLLQTVVPGRADETLTIEQQGTRRTAVIYKPKGASSTPLPLMIVLGGKGETLESLRQELRFDDTADRERFVVMYPQAIDGVWSFGNAGIVATPVINGVAVDDIAFIRAAIDQLVAKGVGARDRIFVTGVSRGALMAFALACSHSAEFAGVAALLTGMTEEQKRSCHPEKPVPLLMIAGTNDNLQPYDGWILANDRLLSVPETLEMWRTLDGCTGQSVKYLTHREPLDFSRIRLTEWTGCQEPNVLRLYRINGGGHQLPSFGAASGESEQRYGHRNLDIETANEIWDFAKVQKSR